MKNKKDISIIENIWKEIYETIPNNYNNYKTMAYALINNKNLIKYESKPETI